VLRSSPTCCDIKPTQSLESFLYRAKSKLPLGSLPGLYFDFEIGSFERHHPLYEVLIAVSIGFC